MAINKTSNGDQQHSPRSVRARYFHFTDHTKNKPIPSILRRRSKLRFTHSEPLEESIPTANSFDYESRTETESELLRTPEKILKIIMPNDLDNDASVPSSFSPPSNKLRMRKPRNDYREVYCNTDITSPRNSVRFHSKVLVMRIPSRNQYPETMKRKMWCSLSEIARSAQRNTIEFCSEGWDWRSAVEEESMYIHPQSGKYIHPVHVRRASATSSSPDLVKGQASAGAGVKSKTTGDHNAKSFGAHAEPAHE